MTKIALRVLCACGLMIGFAGTACAGQGGLPENLVLKYQLNYGELLVGHSHRTLNRQPDGRYLHRTVSQPAGAAKIFTNAEWIEEGEFRVVNGKVQPLTYVKFREGGSKPRRHSVRFEWQKNMALYGDGRNEPLPAGAQDESSVLFEFMLNPPSNDDKGRSVAVSNGKRFSVYRYKATGFETLDTALGRLKTLRLRRSAQPAGKCADDARQGKAADCDGEDQLTLWLAVDRGFLPVKIERRDGGQVATLVLLSAHGA